MPGTANVKKNGTVLIASDLCPIEGCGTKGHLVSDHSASLGRCSKCACVIQDVGNHIGRNAAKIGA